MAYILKYFVIKKWVSKKGVFVWHILDIFKMFRRFVNYSSKNLFRVYWINIEGKFLDEMADIVYTKQSRKQLKRLFCRRGSIPKAISLPKDMKVLYPPAKTLSSVLLDISDVLLSNVWYVYYLIWIFLAVRLFPEVKMLSTYLVASLSLISVHRRSVSCLCCWINGKNFLFSIWLYHLLHLYLELYLVELSMLFLSCNLISIINIHA
jgi:hypothetical protein